MTNITHNVFISTDIEADGKFPGLSSMLSFGSVAVTIDKTVIGSFSRNLDLLPNATPSPDTTKFWNNNPVAYAETRINPVLPSIAMHDYATWICEMEKLSNAKAVFAGYPAIYDFKWIDYYFHHFYGKNPFGFSSVVDMKSIIWSQKHISPFSSAVKKTVPQKWKERLPHTHIAVDDALEQGMLFVNMMRNVFNLPHKKGIDYHQKFKADTYK